MTEAMQPTCICCLGQRAVPHVAGLLRCVDCSHVWADLRLGRAELERLYSASYFHGAEYLDYEREAAALRHNFAPRVAELARRCPPRARLWELGCAYGYFLREAGAYFDAAGCDIAADAVRHAREVLGVAAEWVDFLDRPAGSPFDLVCLWDTVEHLPQPERYLAKAAAELRPGGLLALSTGDIGARLARWRGARWRLIHPPTHLHYFTTRSMTTLLARLGFAQIEIRHLPFWRTSRSVAYRLLAADRPGPGQRLFTALDGARLLDWSFPLNFYDLMTVYAVRR